MDVVRKTSAKRRRRIAIAGLLAMGGAALVRIAWPTTASSAVRVDGAGVWTETVRRGALLRQVPVQGTLVPEHVQWLSAESAARVARIAVRPGAPVEPDTVVVVLENSELELAALEAEGQAASAESALIQLDVRTRAEQALQDATLAGLQAEANDATRQANSSQRLASEGLVSAIDKDNAIGKAEALAARAKHETERSGVLETGRGRQLAAQRAEVERLREIARFRRKQLAALEIRAGIAGVVQEIPLENGQWVAIGTVLAKVAVPDRLKADVRVAEGEAKDVRKGLSVRFDSPQGNFRGHVERVDPGVAKGSVRLDVLLDDPAPSGARADQTVSGYVEIERLENVLFVARPAGAHDEGMVSVFRLEPDGVHASRVTARLGRGSGREIEVLGGLEEGDVIVISDTSAWDSPRIRLEGVRAK